MKNDNLIRIIENCLFIDRAASKIYEKISKEVNDRNEKTFWDQMTQEELEHIVFWEKTLELAQNGVLPNIFDDSSKIIEELEHIKTNTQKLMDDVF